MDINEVTRKAEKLMGLMTSSNEHEANLAENMLAKLLAKYELSMETIIRSKGQSEKSDDIIKEKVWGRGTRRQTWEALMAQMVAKVFDGVIVTSKGVRLKKEDSGVNFNDGWYINFIASKSTLPLILYFFTYFRKNIGRGTKVRFTNIRDRNTYCYSMTEALEKRLKSLYKKKMEAMPESSRALVPVRKDMVAKKMKEFFPKCKVSSVRVQQGSRAAYEAGKYDGQNLSLSRPLPGGSSGRAEIGR